MTSIPEGHDEPMTIDIGGEKVPVMTQAELDPLLTHKVDLSKYQWKYTKPVDVWMTVGKDGTVEQGWPRFFRLLHYPPSRLTLLFSRL